MSFHIDQRAVNLYTKNLILEGDVAGACTISAPDNIANYGLIIPDLAPGAGQILRINNPTTGQLEWTTAGAGSGEINTGSNVGTGTGEVFKQKVSDDLEFRKLASSSTILTVATGTSDINLNIVSTNITSVGELTTGSIATGFGSITTTGAIQGGELTIDDVKIDGSTITMSGASGANQIIIPDNVADGLTITNGSEDYISLDTTDGADKVNILKPTDVIGNVDITGNLDVSGAVTLGSLTASLTDLSDVTIVTPLADQTLEYSGSQWENRSTRKRIDLVNTSIQLVINGIWSAIPFENERKKDSLFTHTASSSEIEFQSADDYMVVLNLILTAIGTDKAYQGRLEKWASPAGPWTAIPYSNIYGISTSNNSTTGSISLFETFAAGDKLRLVCQSISNATTFFTKPGGTMVTVVRL